MTDKLEFSRPIEIDRIPKSGSFEIISADSGECEALAVRLGVPVIHNVKAKLKVAPWRGGGLHITGDVHVDLTRQSVVSLDDFRMVESYKVDRYFVSGRVDEDTDGDIEPLVGRTIDLGEVSAETIGLELDPYPRKPGESFSGFSDDATEDKPENPFANLIKMPRIGD